VWTAAGYSQYAADNDMLTHQSNQHKIQLSGHHHTQCALYS